MAWRRHLSPSIVGSGKSAAMVTTRWRATLRLPLNLSRTGAQENIFYRPDRTCHGIINHTSDGACHANIIRSKNQDKWS
jgi:hypothetical protein